MIAFVVVWRSGWLGSVGVPGCFWIVWILCNIVLVRRGLWFGFCGLVFVWVGLVFLPVVGAFRVFRVFRFPGLTLVWISY